MATKNLVRVPSPCSAGLAGPEGSVPPAADRGASELPLRHPDPNEAIGAQPVGCVAPIAVAEAPAPPAELPLVLVTPNPVRDGGTVEIRGAAGRLVARRELPARGETTVRLAWSELGRPGARAAGVYFLELGDGATGAPVARSRVVVLR